MSKRSVYSNEKQFADLEVEHLSDVSFSIAFRFVMPLNQPRDATTET